MLLSIALALYATLGLDCASSLLSSVNMTKKQTSPKAKPISRVEAREKLRPTITIPETVNKRSLFHSFAGAECCC
jgi:hypothetical protein